jgi:dTDP-4-dehydrorhamnose reductase
VTGTLHCCGGEHADRLTLARRAARAFQLDPELIQTGPPPPDALGPEPIPWDTRLDATATAARLNAHLPNLDAMLAQLRGEIDEASAATEVSTCRG